MLIEKKILVELLHGIGDIVCAVPMLRALRKKFPLARIDVVVKFQTCADVLQCADVKLDNYYVLNVYSGVGSVYKFVKKCRKTGYDIGSVENEIGKMLAECKQKVLYRKHPRETSFSSDWAYVDDGTAMWELVCQEHLSDDSVLISSFSTAMLTPKLLYNKEPWLIYTYKLYKNYFVEDNPMTCGLNQGISVMVEQIKKVYSRPEKIICVQNIKEIKDTLEMIEIE